MLQVPESRSFPALEGDRSGGVQALRRGWNTNRASAFPGGSQSNVLPAGTSSVTNRSSLMTTSSAVPLQQAPTHQTTFAGPIPNANKSHVPLHRTGGAQPVRATVSQPSHIQTDSAVTTLIPQNKAGFSSITISSRRVSRSASLPGSDTRPAEPRSPPMDPNSGRVTVQRKATIVKVTEQRTFSSPFSSTKREGTPPAGEASDTVVHRRKATIIKVTEHRESYSPAREESGTRRPGYRHSYSGGVYEENSTWSPRKLSRHSAAPSGFHLDSTKRPNSAVAPHASPLDPVENDGALRRSSLCFVCAPPDVAAAKPSEVSQKTAGQRPDRPHRPLSCYGNMFGHTEPSTENLTRPACRKQSFGLPQGADTNHRNSNGEEAGQPAADTFKPNATRRASFGLTLIKTPGRFLCPTPTDPSCQHTGPLCL